MELFARIKVTNGGELRFAPVDDGPIAMARLKAAIDKYSREGIVKLTVARPSQKRSDKQNKYLWGIVYPTICDFLEAIEGVVTLPETLHEVMLSKFAPKKPSSIVVKGVEYVATDIIRSSAMTTDEFTVFIDNMIAFWATAGLEIPQADRP